MDLIQATEDRTFCGLVDALLHANQPVDRMAMLDWLNDHDLLDEPTVAALVLAYPDEDGPRLVYADWVEPRDYLRALFIREQIKAWKMFTLASTPIRGLEDRLLEEPFADALTDHGARWLGDPTNYPYRVDVWRRGFCSTVGGDWERLCDTLPRAVQRHPIAKVVPPPYVVRHLFNGWFVAGDNLPQWLTDWMRSNLHDIVGKSLVRFPPLNRSYPSQAAAEDAFTDLILAWAEDQEEVR